MSARTLSLIAATLIGASATVEAGAEEAAKTNETPYRINGGRVDLSTYLGWRAFHSSCHTCHGVDATGTSAAPNLVERIRELSPREFSTKILTSYRLVVPAGDPSALRAEFLEEVLRRESGELVMPAWENKPEVQPFLIDLYAYLRARADGVLGPGKPTLKSE